MSGFIPDIFYLATILTIPAYFHTLANENYFIIVADDVFFVAG